MRAWLKQRLLWALAFSLVFHAFALFGVVLVLPDPRKVANTLQPLEVVLVNSKSKSRPIKADALAQNDLDGGGNTEQDRQAKSPLPTLSDDQKISPEQSAQRVQQLEQEARRLITQLKSTYSVTQAKNQKQQDVNDQTNGQDLVNKALEMARLEAQIAKDMEAYQKMPRRKFIGARTQEFRFAQYVEDWRIKVERVGNLNYPDQARRDKVFGKLQLTVSIRSDGSVESVEVSRSSGHRILDAAAQRIVKLAAPYSSFPADIRRDTDIISITRTWSFTSSDKLESE